MNPYSHFLAPTHFADEPGHSLTLKWKAAIPVVDRHYILSHSHNRQDHPQFGNLSPALCSD
ncbi:hypothetical protein PCANC_02693 [Puccinia coronata f. sp. avenae]|uniref:Uncharacterized protein n=1 Tax=Puccinia coronata f. sp. avenae TaxID=200324 RepID=A0A2N5S4J4_9BASI|nr:hypothetical protein PCANC_22628 [Puccinia coronata f. sp. avenae]PLW27540.1 hypothetical protein PCASD_16265 [Puccinia coronata f. sp. avenae]PLW54963.1 hypothetical protein PCANC_02693 [Puccinia coronata f. sp. avenae]